MSRRLLCAWSLRISPENFSWKQRVVPDGCVDIVWLDDEHVHLAGPATQPFDVEIAPGTTIVGVRFLPGIGCTALGIGATDLVNQVVPLEELLPHLHSRVLGRTRDTPTPQSRLTRLEQVVARHAENSSCDDRVVAALQEIAAVTEPNIEDVAWHVGWCGRQLRRRFQDVVGYGPKTFHRIVRLQRMLSLIRRSRGRIDLSGLAVDSGYADQAHMTREAVALAGQSPRALIAGTAHATLEMSELFNIQDAALR